LTISSKMARLTSSLERERTETLKTIIEYECAYGTVLTAGEIKFSFDSLHSPASR
jgi:hypothetical protein